MKLQNDPTEYFKGKTEKKLGSVKGQEKEFWQIQQLTAGKIKLFSMFYGGPLIASTKADKRGKFYGEVLKDRNFTSKDSMEQFTLSLVQADYIIPDGEYKLFSISHKGPLFSGDGVDSVIPVNNIVYKKL